MARVKINFPERTLFSTSLPVRITDLNYGNHLANDAVLAIAHEARMQWLAQWGYTELSAGEHGLIMADAEISYKGEAFFGDVLTITLYAGEISRHGFELLYRITTERNNAAIEIAHIKTGLVSFDYDTRKVVALSKKFQEKLA
jgi:acyl-CoA thioesterase FadM